MRQCIFEITRLIPNLHFGYNKLNPGGFPF